MSMTRGAMVFMAFWRAAICSQKRLHQELDNMRKQMAALQKAMNTIAPLVMDIPMCA